MSVTALKQATGVTAAAKQTKSFTFPEMLEEYKTQIALALPKHLNPDRMARIALTEFRKNKDLGECDPKTVFASIIIASQLGLEPGINGQAYLVPYKKTCTLIPGWQGYVDLVSRSGRAGVWTDAVREGDQFVYRKGTSPMIEHECGDNADDDSPFTHVYAVGRVRNAEWPIIEVWSRLKVQKHLNRYNKVGTRHYALQNEHNLEMYGRKVALLQVIKYLPKSIELSTATSLDYAADAGTQTISIKEAIEGTFIPAGYQDEKPVIEGELESPELKKIKDAFEVLATPPMKQAELLKEYESKLPELIDKLEAEINKG